MMVQRPQTGTTPGRHRLARSTLLVVMVGLGLVGASGATAASASTRLHVNSHVMPVVQSGPQPRLTGTTDLVYHGGPVMTGPTKTVAIFWEPATLQSGDPGTVSAQYNTLLKRYFTDVGGSGLYDIATQYSSIKNGSQLF